MEKAYEKPNFTVIVARTGSGKTHAMRYVVSELYKQKKIQGVIVFASTARISGDYEWVNERYRYSKLDEKVIKGIFADRAIRKQNGQPVPPIALIMDDVIGDAQLRSNWMSDLSSKSRHYNLYIFVLIQAPKAIKPAVRSNADCIWLFKQPNKEALEEAYTYVDFDDKQEFMEFMKKNIHSYRWLLYNRKLETTDDSEKYAVLLAPKDLPEIYIP